MGITVHRPPSIQRALRSGGLWTMVLGCVLLAGEPARAVDDRLLVEYRLKAGYLFHFAKFVEWPASVLPKADGPFVIGVLDAGESLAILQQALAGKKVDAWNVEVKPVNELSPATAVHVLMVPAECRRTPEEIVTALGRAPVLLVGDAEKFAERGGMIGFVHDNERVRLMLNLEAVQRVSLRVSAKLASVAQLVKKRATP